MKKSLHIDLPSHFRVVETDIDIAPMPSIAYAPGTYYGQGEDQAIAQEFDGRYGYLYRYELTLAGSARIPLRVERGDLHVLYLMEADGDVVLEDAAQHRVCTLSPGRGRYLYLPPGVYRLRLPPGHLLLFGFYFDGGIFREGNERSFDFIRHLIAAYRQQATRPLSSVDFKVGPSTHIHIEHLFDNLQSHKLSTERLILDSIVDLLELSREKVQQQYGQLTASDRLAAKAKKLIETYTEHYGQDFQFTALSSDLGKNISYIKKAFRKLYGLSLQQYKNQLLVEKVKKLLTKERKVSPCAYSCGYSSSEAFCRFFKGQTGYSPSEFIRQIDNEGGS